MWNYFAGYSALISYLFIDNLINFIDQNSKLLKIAHPDAVAGFLMNSKTTIIIILYFIFFILFYKSRLFNVQIEWFFKKLIWYLILPFLTVIDLIFTMMLVINWPDILTYNWYSNLVNSLQISNAQIKLFFSIIPWIIIFIPIFLLLIFLEINFVIRLPLRKKSSSKKEENSKEEIEHHQEIQD